jgi:hypothetical protein
MPNAVRRRRLPVQPRDAAVDQRRFRMTGQPENWVELAEASRTAWEALSLSEYEELLLEVRFEPAHCMACSDCTKPSGHREPHGCDCQARCKS